MLEAKPKCLRPRPNPCGYIHVHTDHTDLVMLTFISAELMIVQYNTINAIQDGNIFTDGKTELMLPSH